MSGPSDDRILVGLAAMAAFGAGLLAVEQHASCTTAGYQLAVAERENIELRRGVEQAERQVTALSTLPAAVARATPMKLSSLRYPKTWNVVAAATLRTCLEAQVSAPSDAVVQAKGPVR